MHIFLHVSFCVSFFSVGRQNATYYKKRTTTTYVSYNLCNVLAADYTLFVNTFEFTKGMEEKSNLQRKNNSCFNYNVLVSFIISEYIS